MNFVDVRNVLIAFTIVDTACSTLIPLEKSGPNINDITKSNYTAKIVEIQSTGSYSNGFAVTHVMQYSALT